MITSPKLWKFNPLILSVALVATLLSVIPIASSKGATVDITTYPQIKTRDLFETQTVSSAVISGSNIVFTTANKNLFSFETPLVGSYSMYVQVTGMVNGGSGCTVSQNANDPIRYDGYNTPMDSLTVTSISASGGVVTYNTALTGQLQSGDEITVSGAANSGFNGTFSINSVSTNSNFTVKSSATGSSSTANARHVRWEKLIGATDYTFTILRSPGSGSCTASVTGASLAKARENGLHNTVSEKTANMAMDASGSLIFMSTGANHPTSTESKGHLYISRNSGVSWKKVDLKDASGVSLGNTGIANNNQTSEQLQYETLYGCQHRSCKWTSVSVSHDGQVLAAASFAGQIVFSVNGGVTWAEMYRERMMRCSNDNTGVNWQEIRVAKDGKKIIAFDRNMGNLFTLDLTKAYTINLSAKLPSNLSTNYGFTACAQSSSVYNTTTNPSVYSTFSTDKALIPASMRELSNLYTMAINKNGTRMVLSYGFQTTIVCTGTGNQWTSCFTPPNPTYSGGSSQGWAEFDIRAAFMSSSGQYITLAGFSNQLLRSTNYGATFQEVSNASSKPSYGYGSSSSGASVCGDPAGVSSIAGSDDGKIQYFVTRNTSYATNGGLVAITPGVCKSTNFGAKGSWTSLPVALFPGSTEDISRKQLFSTVVVGSTGAPVYFGSTGVNMSRIGAATCPGEFCSPNFWSSFSITGPPSIGTPVGTPITAQIYSTVNPPSGASAAITWAIGKTSDGSATAGITISQSGVVAVSSSVAEGSYSMTISATDSGTLTTLQMWIYVYNSSRAAPIFDTPVRAANGYTVNITNYNSMYTYTPTSDTGTIAVGSASGSVLPLTLSGIAESSTAVISVDSYMGTYDTDVFGLKTSTVTGISKWLQATLTFTNSLFVGASGGTRTLTTSGGSGTGAVTFAVTTAGNAGCSIASINILTAASAVVGNTCGITATKAADANYVAKTSASTTFTIRTAGKIPTFGTPIRTSNGFIVAITNYDANFTWSISVNRGSVSVSTPVGTTETLTVTSLSPGESATVSVSTTRTNYADEFSSVLSFSVANLTILALSDTRTVGFTRDQRVSFTGLLGTDSITAVTYSYLGIDETSYATSNSRPTAAGKYSVTPSSAVFGSGSASNYNITYSVGTYIINAAVSVSGGSNISTVFGLRTTSSAFISTGGTGRITFSISGSLAGTSIDSTTGVVTVSAATPIRSTSVNVTATDELGSTDSESITVEVSLGSSSIVLSIPSATSYAIEKAKTIVMTATVAVAGSVTFTANGRKIPGCSNVRTVNFVATCNWKPTAQGPIRVFANYVPDDVNLGSTSVEIVTNPAKRSSPR